MKRFKDRDRRLILKKTQALSNFSTTSSGRFRPRMKKKSASWLHKDLLASNWSQRTMRPPVKLEYKQTLLRLPPAPNWCPARTPQWTMRTRILFVLPKSKGTEQQFLRLKKICENFLFRKDFRYRYHIEIVEELRRVRNVQNRFLEARWISFGWILEWNLEILGIIWRWTIGREIFWKKIVLTVTKWRSFPNVTFTDDNNPMDGTNHVFKT